MVSVERGQEKMGGLFGQMATLIVGVGPLIAQRTQKILIVIRAAFTL